jgi:hypothetical protein
MVIFTLSPRPCSQPLKHLSCLISEEKLGRLVKGNSQTEQGKKERHTNTLPGVSTPALHV